MSLENVLHIIDHRDLTESDLEVMAAMDLYKPRTKFKSGDIAVLRSVPDILRLRHTYVPRFWQVRFVMSRWTYELILGMQSAAHPQGIIDSVDIPPNEYCRPVIYAHGFPHGLNPDTATWFGEPDLRRVKLRDSTEGWDRILDAAAAPYLGHDTENLRSTVIPDLAPDQYSSGSNTSLFPWEEATVHTAALLGLERPLLSRVHHDYVIDQEHDIFE